MLPDATLPVPASLMGVLAAFAPLFTAPSFRTFCGLACGFLAQTGKRTVCGMLAGAGLSRLWPHDRAHWFFSRARWSADDLGLAVAKLVVALLVPAGPPVVVAIDDTLLRRRGKKVWAASWFHDGSAPGPAKTGYGNNWVVAAIVSGCPWSADPWRCRCWPSWSSRTRPRPPGCGWPAAWRHARRGAARPPDPCRRRFRLRREGAERSRPRDHLDHPAAQGRRPVRPAAGPHRQARRAPQERRPPPVPGRARRRRRVHAGHRHPVRQDRHHRCRRSHLPVVLGLRYPPGHRRPHPRQIQNRLRPGPGHHRAAATAAAVIERYAARWSAEVAIQDAKQVFGCGQACNRTAAAVERTVPFQLACQAIAVTWYAVAGHHPADVESRRARAPWYTTKAQPSTADMAAKP